MKKYKFDPYGREVTANELAELLMYLLSNIIRPNDEVTKNNVVLDETFYSKLPEHLKQLFKEE